MITTAPASQRISSSCQKLSRRLRLWSLQPPMSSSRSSSTVVRGGGGRAVTTLTRTMAMSSSSSSSSADADARTTTKNLRSLTVPSPISNLRATGTSTTSTTTLLRSLSTTTTSKSVSSASAAVDTAAKSFRLPDDFEFQCGRTVSSLMSSNRGSNTPIELVYQTYGTLNEDKSNAILYPTSYGAQHTDIEWLISSSSSPSEGILNSNDYYIIIPNMFGNGMSFSPSTTLLHEGKNIWSTTTNHDDNNTSSSSSSLFYTTHYDNVRVQKLLLDSLGITNLQLIYGWSMGAQQGYYFAIMYPTMVQRLMTICGTAQTTDHTKLFLWSLRQALLSDPHWDGSSQFVEYPHDGIRTFGYIYASWAASQPYYNRTFDDNQASKSRRKIYEQLGYTSLHDYIERGWLDGYRKRDPHNLLAMIDTWLRCNVTTVPTLQVGNDNGDDDDDGNNVSLQTALGQITAKTVVMPSTTDLYFTPEDCYQEHQCIPNSTFVPIDSIWGHRAGNPYQHPTDATFIRNTVHELLSS